MRTGPPRTVIDKEWITKRINIDPNTGCWNHTVKSCVSTKPSRNYGRYQSGGKSFLIHRKSFELFKGVIPKGMMVCHKCDNPRCCNPEHLFLGNHKINADDAMSKGRLALGERVGTSKLTSDMVASIRSDHRSSVEISKDFGVHRCTIWNVKTNRAYSCVP